MQYDVVIIGGGIHGLMTAYYLSKSRNIRIALVEQYRIGNSFGSSHGASRIVRATYIEENYRNFMAQIYQEYLPKLEYDLGVKLLYQNPGIFFGEGNLFENYCKGIEGGSLPIKLLSSAEVMSLFPQFKLNSVTSVLYDQTGGVMAADICIQALKGKLIQNGVTILENTKVININSDHEPVELTTETIKLFAHKVVITAGKYVTDLLPNLVKQLDIIEQIVMYVKLQGPEEQFKLGKFPQFSAIYDQVNEIYYGMPELFSKGLLKISQHTTHTIQSYNFDSQSDIDAQRIQKLMSFITKTFVAPVDKIVGTEKCFYTNTQDENFIIDTLPSDTRIVVGSICSGHGFKFAPLTGLILAQLAIDGKTTISEFEKNRSMFSISKYLKN